MKEREVWEEPEEIEDLKPGPRASWFLTLIISIFVLVVLPQIASEYYVGWAGMTVVTLIVVVAVALIPVSIWKMLDHT